MSVTSENKYVWVMEWSDSFDPAPRRHFDVYSIEPQAGVHAANFEKFMTDEIFPVVNLPVDPPSTERRNVVRHYLLKQIGAFGGAQGSVNADYVQDKGSLAKFMALSTTTATYFFNLVGS